MNKSPARKFWTAVTALLLAFNLANLRGAELTVRVTDKEPPRELDESIRAVLQKKAVQLVDGDKPVWEFWLVSELSLQAKPASLAKALDAVKQPALLGSVSVPKALRDYRDDELAAGVYTMRFSLQPQDGNHLGTAEFSYFAALTPAKLDTKPDGITDYKALVKASSKETSTDHPLILSLRPAGAEAGDTPTLQEPASEHKSIRLKVPAKAAGEKVNLSFEIVYEGKGHK